jgi:hypothetical protein
MTAEGFDTPEDAAMAEWDDCPQAEAHVVRVEPCSDPQFPGRVWVVVDTVPSHPMRASCELIDGRWVMVSDITA